MKFIGKNIAVFGTLYQAQGHLILSFPALDTNKAGEINCEQDSHILLNDRELAGKVQCAWRSAFGCRWNGGTPLCETWQLGETRGSGGAAAGRHGTAKECS